VRTYRAVNSDAEGPSHWNYEPRSRRLFSFARLNMLVIQVTDVRSVIRTTSVMRNWSYISK
jgi:hypothetical protein